ncbi:hypothetical protein F8S13_01655 [Chloroflexia bacterium SDU3-3]|nr:hypothetical protein F8S13_01655 [Chloroflexia bacterium SDU3-3]
MSANPVQRPTATPPRAPDQMTKVQPPNHASQAALVALGTALGVAAALALLPQVLPGLRGSLLGAEPKAFWYLSRSSAVVAYALLWLSMASGLLISDRFAKLWPGGPAAFDLHQQSSLLGLAFGLFHALVLLGDRYIQASLGQILTPFAYPQEAQLWVGLGQISIYGMVITCASFYARQQLGRRAWRAIHAISYGVFALALAHGLMSGSDTTQPFIQAMYWGSGASVLFLTCYRVLMLTLARAGEGGRALG